MQITKIRINIIGLNSLPEGENRTVLYIEDVNPKEYAIETGRQGICPGIRQVYLCGGRIRHWERPIPGPYPAVCVVIPKKEQLFVDNHLENEV